MTGPDDSRSPKRIQMSRQRPWRAEHPDAVIVDRRTRWGNPFAVIPTPADDHMAGEFPWKVERRGETAWFKHRADALAEAVQWFRESMDDIARHLSDDAFASEMSELRGRDLACWCPLDYPCHADVLLELAND